MDTVVRSWLYNTISAELQDVTHQNGHTARDAWLALENQFIGNRETRVLHIDAVFRNFVQGDLNMNDYSQKIKGFADSLNDLGSHVSDRVLVLNVLHGLNKQYEHLRAIFTHTTPFPSFQKVRDDLCLKEIQQGIQGTQSAAAVPTAFYAVSKPSAPPLLVGRHAHLDSTNSSNFDLRSSSPARKTATTEVAGGLMVATAAPTEATTTAPPRTKAVRHPGPPSTLGPAQSKCGQVQMWPGPGASDSSPSIPLS
jgi:hypothetical protein